MALCDQWSIPEKDERFVALMELQCEWAEGFYAEADSLLPAEDRRSMRAAVIMRRVYGGILEKMKRDRFRVFEKRYRLSRPRMLIIFGSVAMGFGG